MMEEQNFYAPVGQVAGHDIHNHIVVQQVSRKMTQERIARLQYQGADAMCRVMVWLLLGIAGISVSTEYAGQLWSIYCAVVSVAFIGVAGFYATKLPKKIDPS